MSEKRYHSRDPRNVRDQYLDDITFFQHQVIDTSSVNGQSHIGVITADANGTLIQTQAEPITGRHSIIIANDSSFLIYFSFTDSPTEDERILIPSGTTVTIKTNPNSYQDFYLVSPDITQDIKIIEIA